MQPRPYQQKAIDEIKRLFASGTKRVLLQAATGSGKTFIFSTILNGAKNKGNRCVMAVRGRSLVDQASRRLDEMGVEHSVFMSNDKRFDDQKLIQICSIDSVRSRSYAPPATIVIIDEAHFATSKSFKDFLELYPEAYWLSVTATPWAKGGLRHLADRIIYPISMAELVEQGYLVPAKYFVPTEFDTSKIKVVNGEFDDEQSLVQFEKQSVYGDVVKSFKTKCVGEPTFCFAINIAHANLIREYFEQNNIKSIVVQATTTLVERNFILESLVNGDIDCVISVGTMTTGVDVPQLKNIIMCRPTQSKNLYVQTLGRGTRPFAGKDHFKVIDHVGNVARHGFLIDESIASLDDGTKTIKKSFGSAIPIKTCPACFAVLRAHEKKCNECGHMFMTEETLPTEVENELKELDLDVRSRMKLRAKFFLTLAWERGYKCGFIYVKLKEEFGEGAVKENWQVYRSAKTEYEKWLDGSTPAPCPFATAKNEFARSP